LNRIVKKVKTVSWKCCHTKTIKNLAKNIMFFIYIVIVSHNNEQWTFLGQIPHDVMKTGLLWLHTAHTQGVWAGNRGVCVYCRVISSLTSLWLVWVYYDHSSCSQRESLRLWSRSRINVFWETLSCWKQDNISYYTHAHTRTHTTAGFCSISSQFESHELISSQWKRLHCKHGMWTGQASQFKYEIL